MIELTFINGVAGLGLLIGVAIILRSVANAFVGDTMTDEAPAPDPAADRETFAERLREAELDTQRFIDVHNGEKGTTDHARYEPESDRLSGNYGVYGGSGDGETASGELIDVDVDEREARIRTE